MPALGGQSFMFKAGLISVIRSRRSPFLAMYKRLRKFSKELENSAESSLS